MNRPTSPWLPVLLELTAYCGILGALTATCLASMRLCVDLVEAITRPLQLALG